MAPLAIVVLILVLAVIIAALMAPGSMARVIEVLTAIFLVLAIVGLLRYLGIVP